MSILLTLFKIFYSGTMAVYPTMGMYGSGIIQSVQAGYRLCNHFGLVNSGSRPVNPGPMNEEGTYVWWQDVTLIGKNIYPLVQKAIQGSAVKP